MVKTKGTATRTKLLALGRKGNAKGAIGRRIIRLKARLKKGQ